MSKLFQSESQRSYRTLDGVFKLTVKDFKYGGLVGFFAGDNTDIIGLHHTIGFRVDIFYPIEPRAIKIGYLLHDSVHPKINGSLSMKIFNRLKLYLNIIIAT